MLTLYLKFIMCNNLLFDRGMIVIDDGASGFYCFINNAVQKKTYSSLYWDFSSVYCGRAHIDADYHVAIRTKYELWKQRTATIC